MIMGLKPNIEESSKQLRLSKIPVGETVVILDLQLDGKPRDYVMRFGFVPGASISVLRKVPMSGMRVYQVGQSHIALRPETAEAIVVARSRE
jgi:Fe2+ transport system protein FeoA